MWEEQASGLADALSGGRDTSAPTPLPTPPTASAEKPTRVIDLDVLGGIDEYMFGAHSASSTLHRRLVTAPKTTFSAESMGSTMILMNLTVMTK